MIYVIRSANQYDVSRTLPQVILPHLVDEGGTAGNAGSSWLYQATEMNSVRVNLNCLGMFRVTDAEGAVGDALLRKTMERCESDNAL
jgi:hypothetical protein